ncbi:hypothetical protein [uncultured Jatrophihabitans sp.]|uniref:hypothetical protein n=1 Tax=uncultured Jatrophihabitans sp. TaxID=1610747 RepID=UPI0035CB34B8
MVAISSVVALVAVALFLVAPSSTALTLQASSAGKAPHRTEVLYGKFTNAKGKPANHVRVNIARKNKSGHWVHIIGFSANKKGIYRKVLHRKHSGTYRIRVTARIGHRTYHAIKVFHLRPGHSYRLGGHVSKHALFSFLPVSTY